MRVVEAGCFSSNRAARKGRCTSSSPQLGHRPLSLVRVQPSQKVHSNVQIMACVESGGRSRSQHSQLGRISSMVRYLAIQRDGGLATAGVATVAGAGAVVGTGARNKGAGGVRSVP